MLGTKSNLRNQVRNHGGFKGRDCFQNIYANTPQLGNQDFVNCLYPRRGIPGVLLIHSSSYHFFWTKTEDNSRRFQSTDAARCLAFSNIFTNNNQKAKIEQHFSGQQSRAVFIIITELLRWWKSSQNSVASLQNVPVSPSKKQPGGGVAIIRVNYTEWCS